MKKVNVGMIGFKFASKVHSHAYKDVSMFFKVKAVPVMKVICGPVEEKEALKEAANTYGWENYVTSWQEVVNSPEIDLVDVCVPNFLHKDIVMAAARAGKNIICEKPLAMNLKEAREMLEAVKKNSVKHMICFNYRKVPAIGLAKQLINEGRIGKIFHFRAVYLQDWIVDPDFPLVWRLRKELTGSGVHGDLNAHLIDLARYLVGEFSEVVGMSETFIKKRPLLEIAKKLQTGLKEKGTSKKGWVTVDDTTLFLTKFENGAVGSFEATRFASGRRNGQRIEINGSKGSLLFELEDMNNLYFFSREDPAYMQGFKRIQVSENIHPYMSAWWPAGHIIGWEHTFVHLIADLMNAISEDTMPSPNFIDGVKCQEVLEAVEKSVKQRKWVRIGPDFYRRGGYQIKVK